MGAIKQLIVGLAYIGLVAGCQQADNAIDADQSTPISIKVPEGLPAINYASAIYEIPVKPDVSYEDVIDSLKSISEGMNFVNPANFPIGEHMVARDQSPQGVLEVRAFCNLGMGAEIMMDHPEFVVFAPCRVAIYERINTKGDKQLYLGLDRPTFDLQSINQPSERAKQAAKQLEETLLSIMDRASKGDF